MTPSEQIDNLIATHPDWRGAVLAEVRRIILDVDTGTDDAVAIGLAVRSAAVSSAGWRALGCGPYWRGFGLAWR